MSIRLLDKTVIKEIDRILEQQYSYIANEQERKKKIQEALSKSEEEILRRLPVSLRMQVLNRRKYEKQSNGVEWLNESDIKRFFATYKINPKAPVKPEEDYTQYMRPKDLTIQATDISFINGDDDKPVITRRVTKASEVK